MENDVSVAIPAFNDPPAILNRVLAAARADAPGVVIVVVDMSPDDALAAVCTRHADVRWVHFPESGGVADSRNRLAREAGTRYVVYLDSDAFPEPGWTAGLSAAIRQPDVAVAGSRILPAWERPPRALMTTVTASDWLSLLDLGDEQIDVPMIIGTSYAIDRELCPEPPFDELLGRRPGWPLAMEENRLCETARAAGYRVVYEPRAVVRHHIPAARASWRWMWRHAHTAGRETRVAGRSEQFPRPPLGPRDRLFQLMVSPAFFAGMAGSRRERPGA